MSEIVKLALSDAENTRFTAKSLAHTLYHPVTIGLHGDVGAGKTTFMQALGKELGVQEPITSPTYSLIQEYQTHKEWPLTHIDLYRLSDVEAAEILKEVDHNTICCIEWAKKAHSSLPDKRIDIDIQEKGESRIAVIKFNDVAIPSIEQIEQWRKEVALPAHVTAHCEAVASVAGELADELLHRGWIVRKDALVASGHLHDLLRFIDFKEMSKPSHISNVEIDPIWIAQKEHYAHMRHEQAVSSFLQERGFPDIASMIEPHGAHNPPGEHATTEQLLLFYADKRIAHDKRVSIEERLADAEERYGKTGTSHDSIEWMTQAREIEERFFPDGMPI